MSLSPTMEQSAILEHEAQKDAPALMINALAGTGKSATLKMIDRVHKVRPALYLVFNRRNADEAIKAQKANEFAYVIITRSQNSLTILDSSSIVW